MDIAQSLRVALALRNKKATEVARETGIGDSYLSLLKRGLRTPSLEVVQLLADNLEYKVSEFIALGEQ